MGHRLIVLSLVNHTEKESSIMSLFKLDMPDQLPAVKAATIESLEGCEKRRGCVV
jgi:hypothetical protein